MLDSFTLEFIVQVLNYHKREGNNNSIKALEKYQKRLAPLQQSDLQDCDKTAA